MGAVNRYSDEIRRRAIEEVTERGRTSSEVARDLGITQTTISTWVRQYRRDHGLEPGPTTEQTTRIKELEKEVADLRRTNEILKRASAFFAQEADRTRTR
jgi:transposase